MSVKEFEEFRINGAVAVPARIISFIWDSEKEVLVIRKVPIKVEASAGARHRCFIEFPLLPRGGIKMFRVDPPRFERELEVFYVKRFVIYERRNRFFALRIYKDITRSGRVMIHLPNEVIGTKGEGYLIFKQINKREMRLCKEEPRLVLVTLKHEVKSRTHEAKIKMWGEGITWYKSDSTSTSIVKKTVAMALVEIGKTIYVATNKAPYRREHPEEWEVEQWTFRITEKGIEKETKFLGVTTRSPEEAVPEVSEEEII